MKMSDDKRRRRWLTCLFGTLAGRGGYFNANGYRLIYGEIRVTDAVCSRVLVPIKFSPLH